MVARYRYMFYDALTNTPTIELPLYGTWFQRVMGKPGNATFTVKFNMEGISNADILEGTLPGRTKLYVERDGRIIWGGLVWTRTWEEQARALNCTAQTIESYPYMQVIEENPGPYAGVDQRNIMIDLFNHMQAKPYSDINIVTPAPFADDIVRTVDFSNYEAWTYGRAIEYLIDYDQGFDYTIECQWGSDDKPLDLLRIDNVLGQSIETTGLVFDFPGNVRNFWFPENVSRAAITTVGYGKGEGTSVLRSKHTHTEFFDAGYPDLQRVFSDKDVAVQATLDSKVKAFGDLRRPPMVTPTIEIHASMEPQFGSWSLGDYARVYIESARFPDGHEMYIRVIGYELSPPSKATELEKVKLILAEVEN